MTETAKDEMRRKLGNLTQLRELLFGEQIEQYESKFQQHQERLEKLESNLQSLESNLQEFQLDIEEKLNKMQLSLSSEINTAVNALEKRLQYLGLNTQSEVTKLQQDIKTKTKNNSQIIDAVATKFSSETEHIREEINQTKKSLEQDLMSLKKQLLDVLEQDLSQLKDSKISRDDFAELLFQVCFKIKGADVNSTFAEAANLSSEVKGELLLPENN